MVIYLVDGTYELFRAYHALPPLTAPDGKPAGAVLGLVQSLLLLLRQSAVTHIGCAFDHTIESFRNDMFASYKTGRDTPPDLLEQFELGERAVAALGITAWPMEEFEADDAIASAVAQLRGDPAVDRIVVCSPDKDLAQLVDGQRIVCLDRRRNQTFDEAGVVAKFGVLACVDTRSAGSHRRRRRRHTGVGPLGSQVVGPGAGPLFPHREHPGRP